jgi:hypothetical protein
MCFANGSYLGMTAIQYRQDQCELLLYRCHLLLRETPDSLHTSAQSGAPCGSANF